MPVQRTHKASELEKRLKILENQLYGKKLDVRSEKLDLSSNIQHPTSSSDVTYLKQDLTKIAVLAGLAIGIQLILYFSHALEGLNLF